MGTTSHIIMKIFIAISALVACGLAAEEAKVIASPLAYGYPYAGYGAGYGYAGYPYAAPVAAYAPYAPYSAGSQFHAQDEFGNLNYGYANLNSAKQEIGNTYGGVNGGYSYVDANGKLQQVTYVADGAGFRVADSRLPVAPVYDGVAPTFNPEPLVAPTFNPELPVAPPFNPEPLVAPEVTPEVAQATEEHLAAVAAAAAAAAAEPERKRREAEAEADPAILAGYSKVISAPTPLIHNAPALPYAGYAGYAGLPYAGYAGYAGLPYLG